LHEIKTRGEFGRDEKSKFDSALTELQMRLYLTICGTNRRRNNKGEEYGWNSTMFCTTEQFWEHTDVFARAEVLSEDGAFAAICERVLKLNPNADEKKMRKFAYGRQYARTFRFFIYRLDLPANAVDSEFYVDKTYAGGLRPVRRKQDIIGF